MLEWLIASSPVEHVPASWPLWARITYRAGPHCPGTQVKDGSYDLGLARENAETSPWSHGLWLAQPLAEPPLFPQSLLIRDTLFTITAACAKPESRAVLALIVPFAPHRPAALPAPLPAGCRSSPWVGYGTFQCSLCSSPTFGAQECQFGRPWPELPPLRGLWPLGLALRSSLFHSEFQGLASRPLYRVSGLSALPSLESAVPGDPHI